MIKIDGYNNLEEVGRGSMGVVFRATHASLGRTVALKVLTPGLLADADVATIFAGERAQAGLSNPHVITIHDAGTRNGHTFVAMEFVDGTTLRDKLRDGPLALEEACNITLQVLDGVAAMHDEGIIHGDIKPANIMITKTGLVKVADFGLARIRRPGADETTTLSTLGGSPAYMAPESITHTDRRSDLYAVGLTLYEMLAGELPFDAKSDLAEIFRIKRNDLIPSLAANVPSVPPSVDDAVMTALRSDPDRRFQSASVMSSAVSSAVSSAMASAKSSVVSSAMSEAPAGPAEIGVVKSGIEHARSASSEWGAVRVGVTAALILGAALSFFAIRQMTSARSEPSPVAALGQASDSSDTPAADASTSGDAAPNRANAGLKSPAPGRANAAVPPDERARLVIGVEPAGTLFMDNEPLPGGTHDVAAGDHVVSCEHDGFRADTTIALAPNTSANVTCHTQIDLDVAIRTNDGAAVWAAIWVDGENTATASDRRLQLSVGDHELFVRRRGYISQTRANVVAVRPTFFKRQDRLVFVLEASDGD